MYLKMIFFQLCHLWEFILPSIKYFSNITFVLSPSTPQRKTENSEQNKLAEGIHGHSGTHSTRQVPLGSPVVMGPSCSFLLLGPVEEASRASYFPCGVSWGGRDILGCPRGKSNWEIQIFHKVFCAISGLESGSWGVACRTAQEGPGDWARRRKSRGQVSPDSGQEAQ